MCHQEIEVRLEYDCVGGDVSVCSLKIGILAPAREINRRWDARACLGSYSCWIPSLQSLGERQEDTPDRSWISNRTHKHPGRNESLQSSKSCGRKLQKTHVGIRRKAETSPAAETFKHPESSIWRKAWCFKEVYPTCLLKIRTEYFPHWCTVWSSRSATFQCGGNIRSTAAGSLATKLSFIYPLKICTSE